MNESFENAAPRSPVGRTLPHNIDAEELLLSCCFLDGAETLARCIVAGIKPESFYLPAHGLVFDVLLDLYRTQRPIDVSIVAVDLKTRRLLDQVGGYPFLTQISIRAPTTAQAVYFIEKVRELSALRDVIRAATGIVEDAYNYSGGLDQFLARASEQLSHVTTLGVVETEETIQAVAGEIVKDFSRAPEERAKTANLVSWGLADIDRFCGKMSPGSLNVLAGMPSTGKSALADRVAWKTAEGGTRHVLMFTYEMTKRDKAVRIAQQEARLNFDKFDDSPLDMKVSFRRAVERIVACKTLHVFEKDKTINRLVGRCRMLSRKMPIGLIVVDFLQYLSRLEPTIGKERTDEKIGRLTADLKSVAMDCNCPVLLLSSLNRSEYRDGNRPTMAGLKGSGEIESDADTIGILHWPKLRPDKEEQDPHDDRLSYYVEFNQEKGRNKGVHTVGLTFHRDITLFENYHA